MKKKTVVKKVTKKTVDNLYVNFVLDESGSMEVCRQATISGFNEYIKTLKSKAKNVFMTLTKFNTNSTKTVYSAMPIKDVKELNEDTYIPASTTPLYDAIAKTVKDTTKKGDVLCVIMTDGDENSSREYTREKIFDLIKAKEKEGWSFIYLGANQDSWATGQTLGLSKGNVVNYSTKNMDKAMNYVGASTMCFASMSTPERAQRRSTVLDNKEEAEKELTD